MVALYVVGLLCVLHTIEQLMPDDRSGENLTKSVGGGHVHDGQSVKNHNSFSKRWGTLGKCRHRAWVPASEWVPAALTGVHTPPAALRHGAVNLQMRWRAVQSRCVDDAHHV
jgi:hypothetical protein